MKILIDTDERFFHRGNPYYPGRMFEAGDIWETAYPDTPHVFCHHDLVYADKRAARMKGLVPPIPMPDKKPWWRFWK